MKTVALDDLLEIQISIIAIMFSKDLNSNIRLLKIFIIYYIYCIISIWGIRYKK